jgi:hypothetical protein
VTGNLADESALMYISEYPHMLSNLRSLLTCL